MIANVVRGRGFRGLLDYLFQPDKAPEIVAGNMAGLTARDLASEFAGVRSANDKVKTPVFHCSLSLPPSEHLDRQRWAQGAERFLKELGLTENRPWLAVRHGDKDHDHVHIVTSRTAYDGKVWYGEWEVKKVLQAKAVVERELGLAITPRMQPDLRISKAQLRQAERMIEGDFEGELLPTARITQGIDEALASSGGDYDRFVSELKKGGITIKVNKSESTGRISGAAFSGDDGQTWAKGSQLGKAYRWAELSARIADTPKNHSDHETIGAKEYVNEPDKDRSIVEPIAGRAASDTHGNRVGEPSCSGERNSLRASESISFPVFTASTLGRPSDGPGEASRRADISIERPEGRSIPATEPTASLSTAFCAAANFAVSMFQQLRVEIQSLFPFLGINHQKMNTPENRYPEII